MAIGKRIEGTKHEPTRSCLVCRTKKPKKQLLRIVSQNGILEYDKLQTIEQRGVYVCQNTACMVALAKRNTLSRSEKLKTDSEQIRRIAALLQAEARLGE